MQHADLIQLYKAKEDANEAYVAAKFTPRCGLTTNEMIAIDLAERIAIRKPVAADAAYMDGLDKMSALAEYMQQLRRRNRS